jgi:hypothetical protein
MDNGKLRVTLDGLSVADDLKNRKTQLSKR